MSLKSIVPKEFSTPHVLSRVGGFRLGKLVSILSNKNKTDGSSVHSHTQTLCRTLYDVVGNGLYTLITIGS